MAGAVMLCLLALAPCAQAEAVDYVVVPEQSSVSFRFTENGADRSGEFEDFRGHGRFDQSTPAQAGLQFSVEAGSIDLGNRLVNAFAQTEEWFDSADHPRISFRLTKLEPITTERYLAEGVLAMRGRSLPVSAPVRLVFGPGEVRASGDLRVDRTDYGLGLGASQAFVDIGEDVSVEFDLVARPAN